MGGFGSEGYAWTSDLRWWIVIGRIFVQESSVPDIKNCRRYHYRVKWSLFLSSKSLFLKITVQHINALTRILYLHKFRHGVAEYIGLFIFVNPHEQPFPLPHYFEIGDLMNFASVLIVQQCGSIICLYWIKELSLYLDSVFKNVPRRDKSMNMFGDYVQKELRFCGIN